MAFSLMLKCNKRFFLLPGNRLILPAPGMQIDTHNSEYLLIFTKVVQETHHF